MKQIFTDGSCINNGKSSSIGGWAAIVMQSENEIVKTYYKNDIANTTNNRMELSGMIAAIRHCLFCEPTEEFIIYCDSAYVVNIINDWMWKWFRNGWTRASNQPIENLDLIQEIFQLYNRSFVVNFTVKKVSGHSEIVGNELADAYATKNSLKLQTIFSLYNIILEK